MFMADLSMNSSHGMSSFLQDFDLGGEQPHAAFGKLDVNYRTQPIKDVASTIGVGIEDDEFCMVVRETPIKSNHLMVTQESGRASM